MNYEREMKLRPSKIKFEKLIQNNITNVILFLHILNFIQIMNKFTIFSYL